MCGESRHEQKVMCGKGVEHAVSERGWTGIGSDVRGE